MPPIYLFIKTEKFNDFVARNEHRRYLISVISIDIGLILRILLSLHYRVDKVKGSHFDQMDTLPSLLFFCVIHTFSFEML